MKPDKMLLIALILFFIVVIMGIGYLYFVGTQEGPRCVNDPFGYIKDKLELECYCFRPLK